MIHDSWVLYQFQVFVTEAGTWVWYELWNTSAEQGKKEKVNTSIILANSNFSSCKKKI